MNKYEMTERDLAFLNSTHQMGKMMGVSDKDIIKIAKTNGDIDPEAMRLYLEKHQGES